MIDHDAIPDRAPSKWAVVTTFESQSPEAVEEALRHAVDDSIPAARNQPGWKGALVFANDNRSHGMVVVFWDSVQSLIANARLAQGAGAPPEGVRRTRDRFEVVHDERPDE